MTPSNTRSYLGLDTEYDFIRPYDGHVNTTITPFGSWIKSVGGRVTLTILGKPKIPKRFRKI